MSAPAPEPCRVLILNERDPRHPQAGGAEIHVSEIFSRLVVRGYDVTLLASRFEGAPAREEVEGLKVRRLGGLVRYYPEAALRCARETMAGRYDVVVECLNKVPYFSPIYSSVPVLAICHHLFGEAAFSQAPWPIAASVWSLEKLIPWLYPGCPFVAISESSGRDLVERGIPGDKVRVSHCGIEPSRTPIDTEKSRPPVVAYVGRIEAYKHVDVMLRAMARLSDRFPEARILVIGKGAMLESLRELAEQLGLGGRTRFTGFVSNEERDALLAGARVCVCPSEKEGWGLTVIEANSSGTPVVASDAPGLRDSVRHGETGFLAPVGDVGAFAERIGELLDDDAMASRMSRAALAWSKEFDWDRAAEDMAEALEAVRRPS